MCYKIKIPKIPNIPGAIILRFYGMLTVRRLVLLVSSKVQSCCKHAPQRYIICALTCTALVVCFMERVLYYEAVQALVYTHNEENLNTVSKCVMMAPEQRSNKEVILYWTPNQKRSTYQAFFMGYFLTAIPSGILSDFQGPKFMIGVGVVATSFLTLLVPPLIKLGNIVVVSAARFVLGMAQGMVIPSTAVVIARWAPVSQRTFYTSLINSGFVLGWFLGYWLHQLFYISQQWEAQFYITGTIGLLWLPFWIFYSTSLPTQNPFISQAELDLICKESGFIKNGLRLRSHYIPWKEMFTSPPMLSLIAINFVSNWTHIMTVTLFKEYFVTIGLNEKLSSDSTNLAQITMVPSMILWGYTSDWLINHNYMSRTINRKFFGVLCYYLMLLAWLIILLLECQHLAAMSMYLVACYLHGPYFSVLSANPIDLSPRHAGILQSILNGTAHAMGLFYLLVHDKYCDPTFKRSDVTCWWVLFSASCVLVLIFVTPYLLFGSGDVQPWNFSTSQPRTLPSPLPNNTTSQEQQNYNKKGIVV